jgi:hypothetical protein
MENSGFQHTINTVRGANWPNSYNANMKSFKWKGIPVNIPDSRSEWILLVILPLSAVVVINLSVLILRLIR